jgi:parallel beta-helix repeat protein
MRYILSCTNCHELYLLLNNKEYKIQLTYHFKKTLMKNTNYILHLFFLFILSSLSLSIFSQTSIPAGNVSGLWIKPNSPYIIEGDIKIPADSLLIIEPGVIIEFQGSYKFIVLGQLLAVGNITDTIVFTAQQEWNALLFTSNSSSDTSRIAYCKLEKSKHLHNSWPSGWGGAISVVNYTNLIISNSTIINNKASWNGGGIYCYASSPVIKNNLISNNFGSEGGGIFIKESNAIITGNYISNNNATLGGGGAIFLDLRSNPIISKNIITNNFSYSGAGIDCVGANPLIIGNNITNNIGNSGGIQCGSSSPLIINNVICNNTATYGGGAIACYWNSSPNIINNTLSNNHSDGVAGSVFLRGESNPTFINSILYGNTSTFYDHQIHSYDETSQPNFINCNIEDGIYAIGDTSYYQFTGVFKNNINLPSLHTSATFGSGASYDALLADWSLQDNSPCVNAGTSDTTGLNLPTTDHVDNPRVLGIVDIGAFENQVNTSLNKLSFNNFFLLFPNPSEGKTNLIFDNLNNEKIKLEIISSTGQTIFSKKLRDNSNLIEQLDLTDFIPGIYFVKIKSDNISIVQKLILLK